MNVDEPIPCRICHVPQDFEICNDCVPLDRFVRETPIDASRAIRSLAVRLVLVSSWLDRLADLHCLVPQPGDEDPTSLFEALEGGWEDTGDIIHRLPHFRTKGELDEDVGRGPTA